MISGIPNMEKSTNSYIVDVTTGQATSAAHQLRQAAAPYPYFHGGKYFQQSQFHYPQAYQELK